jgi:NAD(P)-dependent dehydrogenase (short-subunit alcohol dehydrogenase family)
VVQDLLAFSTRNLKPCCHSGKVAVITGGTSGIGARMARVFVGEAYAEVGQTRRNEAERFTNRRGKQCPAALWLFPVEGVDILGSGVAE